MKVDNKVIRKNHKGGVGTIERISKTRAYIRWHDALSPFGGGNSDNHSTVKISSIVPATEENLAKQEAAKKKRKMKWAIDRYNECKEWEYCPHCHTRLDNTYTCYRCGAIPPEQAQTWLNDTKTGRQIINLFKENNIEVK